jgi:hypothetical protein
MLKQPIAEKLLIEFPEIGEKQSGLLRNSGKTIKRGLQIDEEFDFLHGKQSIIYLSNGTISFRTTPEQTRTSRGFGLLLLIFALAAQLLGNATLPSTAASIFSARACLRAQITRGATTIFQASPNCTNARKQPTPSTNRLKFNHMLMPHAANREILYQILSIYTSTLATSKQHGRKGHLFGHRNQYLHKDCRQIEPP